MKDEKKEYLVHRQLYVETVNRNKKLGLVNMFIFAIALGLKYIGMSDLGGHFIWLGIIILVYIFGSNLLAKYEMKKHEMK